MTSKAIVGNEIVFAFSKLLQSFQISFKLDATPPTKHPNSHFSLSLAVCMKDMTEQNQCLRQLFHAIKMFSSVASYELGSKVGQGGLTMIFLPGLGLAKNFNVSIKLFYVFSGELQKDYLALNRFDLSLNQMRITLNCQCDLPIKMFVQRIT